MREKLLLVKEKTRSKIPWYGGFKPKEKGKLYIRLVFVLFLSTLFMGNINAQTRSVSNTTLCSNTPVQYGVTMNVVNLSGVQVYFQFEGGATFTEFTNGTARLQGTIRNRGISAMRFNVDVTFSGRTFSAPGTPNSHACLSSNMSTWYYYTNISGTFTGLGTYSGARLSVRRFSKAPQIGNGANITHINNTGFGLSGWHNVSIQSQPTGGAPPLNIPNTGSGASGDFNFMLSGSPLQPEPVCQNITNGGRIGPNQAICEGTSPSRINNLQSPSGGSGNIEYRWLRSTGSCPTNSSQIIFGANSSSYQPGNLTQTTRYVRQSRRENCTDWVSSNCVTITVNDDLNDGGTIGSNQTVCPGESVATLTNESTPSGGSGSIEYQWLSSTSGCPTSGSDRIFGANSSTYNPGTLTQTTFFVRRARTSGCSDWQLSNCVTVTVAGVSDAGRSGVACNDNGTGADPSDDYVEFSLDPTGTNLGSSYTVTVNRSATVTLANGNPATGLAYGSLRNFRLSDGTADNRTYRITITDDDDPSCSVTTTVRQASCSDDCLLQDGGLTLQECDPNGTGADPADDFVTFSLNPTGLNLGSTYTVSVNTGTISSTEMGGVITGVSYGAPRAFRLQDGSANGTDFIVTITDDAEPGCKITVTINQANCSNGCTLTNEGITGSVCNDNSTPTEPSDDFITFSLNPTGTSLGGSYSVTVDGGTTTITPTDMGVDINDVPYGVATEFRLGNGSSDGTIHVIRIEDNVNSLCVLTTAVSEQSCSNQCIILSSGLSDQECNDGGTNDDPIDDFITFRLNPTGNNLAANYTVTSNTGTLTLLGGGGTANLSYGTSRTFRLQAGSADGATTFTITITDDADGSCQTVEMIQQGSCSAIGLCPEGVTTSFGYKLDVHQASTGIQLLSTTDGYLVTDLDLNGDWEFVNERYPDLAMNNVTITQATLTNRAFGSNSLLMIGSDNEIYGVGNQTEDILDGVNFGSGFQQSTNGLPTKPNMTPVTHLDVRQFKASSRAMAILDDEGNVYIGGDRPGNIISTGTANNQWTNLTIPSGRPIVQIDLAIRSESSEANSGLFALDDQGNLFVGGTHFLGDGTGRQNVITPGLLQMDVTDLTLNPGESIAQIEMTGNSPSYYVLTSQGRVFVLGENRNGNNSIEGQLGVGGGTQQDVLIWQEFDNSNLVADGVTAEFIASASEGNGAGLIASDGSIYTWGTENFVDGDPLGFNGDEFTPTRTPEQSSPNVPNSNTGALTLAMSGRNTVYVQDESVSGHFRIVATGDGTQLGFNSDLGFRPTAVILPNGTVQNFGGNLEGLVASRFEDDILTRGDTTMLCMGGPTCNILAAGLTDEACDPNGTLGMGADGDDFISFTLDPTGSSLGSDYTVTVDGGGTVFLSDGVTLADNVPFGTATSLRLQDGSADGSTTYTLTITSNSNVGCTIQVPLSVQASCSIPPCDLTDAGLTAQACDANGTTADPSDDFVTFSLNPVNAGSGTTYSVSGGGVTLANGNPATGVSYGMATAFRLPEGSADGTVIVLTITDTDDAGCEIMTTVSQAACSNDCVLTDAGLTLQDCNNNGTTTDPDDDYITFSVNPVGMNLGSSYAVSVDAGTIASTDMGGTTTGIAYDGAPKGFRLEDGSADDATTYEVTITDEDLGCIIDVMLLQAPCSNECDLTDAGLSGQDCNNNGTFSDPSDDYVTFTVDPVGTNLGATYTVTASGGGVVTQVSNNNPAEGIDYGSPVTLRLQDGSADGTTYNITITDDDRNCSVVEMVTQASCSAVCQLSDAGETAIDCNNNGTTADASDDYVTFSLNPTGLNLGSGYTVMVDNGGTLTFLNGDPLTTVSYGSATAFRLQDGSADNTEYLITIIDNGGDNCQTSFTLMQGSCSPDCELTDAGKTMEACNDNGSASDASDDYITFSLNPTGFNLGADYSVAVSGGAMLTRTGPGAINNVPYNTDTEFRLQNGSADGSTEYTITITDNTTGSCQVVTTVMQTSCSFDCEITDDGLSLESCNDNGTPSDPSDDYITFTLTPTGFNVFSYEVTADNGGIVTKIDGTEAIGLVYGVPTELRLQNGSADGTTYNLTITEEINGTGCDFMTSVMQNSCSDVCDLADAGETLETCNDNGTNADPSDDYITFSLNPTGMNLGSNYSVSVNNSGTITRVDAGDINSVNYGAPTEFRLQNGSADASTIYVITITDNTSTGCQVTTMVRQGSCSSDCDLTGAGLTLETCNNNGTVSDPSDDFVSFSLNPTGVNLGATYTVTANNGGTVTLTNGDPAANINYGAATAFRLQDGSSDGTTYTITITDAADPSCRINTVVMQNSCSDVCELTDAGETLETCNDNGSHVDPSDDYITFSLNPTGSNLTTYTVTANNSGMVTLANGDPATNVSYGAATAFRLQNGSADGSTNYTITVTDDADGGCTVTTMAMQNPCSDACLIADIGVTLETCNPNGTSSDPSDDYITFSLNPTGTNIGATYSVSVSGGGVVTRIDAGDINSVNYGAPTEFRLQNGSADGSIFVVTVTDGTDGGCQLTTQLSQMSCSADCDLTDAGKSLETCNDNGTVADASDDYITFSLNPVGTNIGDSYSVMVSGGATLTLADGVTPATMLSYGLATDFRLQDGSADGTTFTITITDDATGSCQVITTVNQSSCSSTCDLTDAGLTLESCNDNNTPTDETDDYITFSLDPVGSNIGSNYAVEVDNGGVITRIDAGDINSVNYGAPIEFRLQNGSADNTTYTITIIDNGDGSCRATTMVMQSPCPTLCDLTDAGETLETCNDNGTPSDVSDDYITFSLNPVGMNTGANYSVAVDNGGVITRIDAGDINSVNYGAPTEFRLQNGSANGLTAYTVTITDSGDGSCQVTTVVFQDPCSPDCELTDAGETMEACNDNGTSFDPSDDYITFSLQPIGLNITGSTYSVTVNGGAMVTLLNGDPADNIDYLVPTEFRLQNGSADGTTFTVTITDDTNGSCSITTDVVQSACSVEQVAVGNRIFMDNDNNGTFDLGTDVGIEDVTVELYNSGDDPGMDTPIATMMTNSQGYFYFDVLDPGAYFVHIPAVNFSAGEPLEDQESVPNVGMPDETTDNDDNGVTAEDGGISSNVFTLTANTQPTGEDQTGYTGPLDDDDVNATIDFAFRNERVAVGNAIFTDLNGNGTFESGVDEGVAGVTVELHIASAVPGIDPPLATETTDAQGIFFFDDLNRGDYFLYIPASNFAAGQPLNGQISFPGLSFDQATDNDDNGADFLINGGLQSSGFTLRANNMPTGEDQTGYMGTLDDDNVNATIDFAFVGNTTFAENDINQTPINVPVSGDVSTNDFDPEGDNQTRTSFTYLDMSGVEQTVMIPTDGSTTTPVSIYDADMVLAGTIVFDNTGAYTYTPATDYTGSVPLSYTIEDDGNPVATDEATLDIDVIPADGPGNEPPVANDDTNTTEENVPVSDNVIDPNDFDPDTPQDDLRAISFMYTDVNDVIQTQAIPTNGSPSAAVSIYDEDGVLAGTITLDNEGDYTFTPATDYTGKVSIKYTIEDPEGGSDDATLTIEVLGDPDMDINRTFANDDANSGPVDVQQTGNIILNDFDPEGDTQTVTSATSTAGTTVAPGTPLSLPSGGTVTILDGGGDYEYDPAPGFVGTEIVVYTIQDDGSPVARDTATLYLTTVPFNETFAENDINQTPINVPVSGDVSTNDFDPEGDNQTRTSFTYLDMSGVEQTVMIPTDGSTTTPVSIYDADMVLAGTIVFDNTGAYTYTPATDYTGSVPLSYTIEDDGNPVATDEATLDIDVIPADGPGNEPPVANDDTNTTEENVPVSDNVIDPNDFDPDTPQDDLRAISFMYTDVNDVIQTQAIPTNGSPSAAVSIYDEDGVLAGTITLDNEGDYTFTPATDYTGKVSIKYTIEDPEGGSDDATLTIEVLGDPDMDINRTFANDDANSGPVDVQQTGNIILNDFDPEGDTQTVTSATSTAGTTVAPGTPLSLPSGGTVTILDGGGDYEYDPAPGFVGTEIVVYTIQDDGSPVARDTATLYLTTVPFNETFAENDINQTPINVPVSGDVSTNDFDPEGDNQTRTSFTYLDMSGVEQTVMIPTDGSTTTPVSIYDADMVLAGTIVFDNTGTYTYTPATDYTGSVPLSYAIEDDGNPIATDVATLDIDVIPINDTGNEPPVANDDTNTTEEDVPVSDNVIDPNDFDPDTPQDDLRAISFMYTDVNDVIQTQAIPTNGSPSAAVSIYDEDGVLAGTITLDNEGDYTFTPATGYTGSVSIKYTIEDPEGGSDDATLTIEVLGDPDMDINRTFANDDANSGPVNVQQTGNIILNDFDPEGDTQTVTSATSTAGTTVAPGTPLSLPSGGTVTILNGGGDYEYDPAPDFVGTEIVVYTIQDDGSPVARDTATLYLTTNDILCVEIETFVRLEGAIINPQTGTYLSQMRTTLNDSKLLPGQFSEDPFLGSIYTPILGSSGQVYNVGPWNYDGGEGSSFDSGGMSANADANYPSDVVDWVLVSLRSDPADGSEALCQRAGLLFADGHIEFLSSADCCNLDPDGSYYVVIEHRNHLLVMSHEAVPIVNGTITYDFRSQQSFINDPFMSGAFFGQIEVASGVFAMYAGNGEQELSVGDNEDTDINAADFAKWVSESPQIRVYNIADYNMDGDISALDFELWQKNSPRLTSVPRD